MTTRGKTSSSVARKISTYQCPLETKLCIPNVAIKVHLKENK